MSIAKACKLLDKRLHNTKRALGWRTMCPLCLTPGECLGKSSRRHSQLLPANHATHTHEKVAKAASRNAALAAAALANAEDASGQSPEFPGHLQRMIRISCRSWKQQAKMLLCFTRFEKNYVSLLCLIPLRDSCLASTKTSTKLWTKHMTQPVGFHHLKHFVHVLILEVQPQQPGECMF